VRGEALAESFGRLPGVLDDLSGLTELTLPCGSHCLVTFSESSPRIARHVSGVIMIFLQIILILSGNLSFLNLLTIVPALACFDDKGLSRVLPKGLVRRATAAVENAETYRPMEITAWVITVIIGFLSIQPAVNMLSSRQIMNTSFDPLNLSLDYALSDRDIRHKFNFFTYVEMGWGFEGNFRVQGRTAQPITPATGRTATNRNTERKDNEYFSFDWRVQRPIKLSDRFSIIPIIEMFNTFNNTNNINPLTTPGLFNFDGFLRQGVGDPRQVQLAVKLRF